MGKRIETLLIAVIIVLNIAFITSNEVQSEFDDLIFKKYQKFLIKFERSYTTLEEVNTKYQVFKKNYLTAKMVDLETSGNGESNSGKNFGTTQFMDVSEDEFKSSYLTLNVTSLPNDTDTYFKDTEEDSQGSGRFLEDSTTKNATIDSETIPENWDWTEKGAVSPVRYQGVCGSCWAFSAVSNIESQYFLKFGKLPSFSEQQLIDCDPYNSGCIGGIMHSTFYYIKQFGLETRTNYPYEFVRGVCKYSESTPKMLIKGYTAAGTVDEEKIKEMLYKKGPLSITINARLLQYYRGGVINIPYDRCPYSPNHGVNIVGYGTTADGIDYWKVRNTWGPYWGEKGYFRIARGRGLCGVNQYVITSVLN